MYHYTSSQEINSLGTREKIEYIKKLQDELKSANSFIEGFVDLYKELEPKVAYKDDMTVRAEEFINKHNNLN